MGEKNFAVDFTPGSRYKKRVHQVAAQPGWQISGEVVIRLRRPGFYQSSRVTVGRRSVLDRPAGCFNAFQINSTLRKKPQMAYGIQKSDPREFVSIRGPKTRLPPSDAHVPARANRVCQDVFH